MVKTVRVEARNESNAIKKAEKQFGDANSTGKVVNSYESVALKPDGETPTTWVVELE